MTEKTISNHLLGKTACWAAAVRAAESSREDRLFYDPWAVALAGKEGETWLAGRPPGSTLTMTLRTRYFDDFLMRVTQLEGINQVVFLAAGMDTRAFRLAWPEGTILFELDQPFVFEYKEKILSSFSARAACERRLISVDLSETWRQALIAANFDPQKPSCWLLEGFLFYLPNETITQMIDVVTGLAASGSWMGFDINNSAVMTSPYTKAWVEMQSQLGAPWLGALDDPESFLNQLGWNANLTQAGQPDANYNRWTLPVIPTRMANMPHNWFVTAKKLSLAKKTENHAK